MVSNGFNKLEVYFSLMWKYSGFPLQSNQGPRFFPLVALSSFGCCPHLCNQDGSFPHPYSCQQKEGKKGRHTPSSERLNPEVAYITLAHSPLARTQSYGHTIWPHLAVKEARNSGRPCVQNQGFSLRNFSTTISLSASWPQSFLQIQFSKCPKNLSGRSTLGRQKMERKKMESS